MTGKENLPTADGPSPSPSTEHPAAPLAPTAPAERLTLVDSIRGFALAGVLVANLPVFAHPLELRELGAPPIRNVLDWIGAWTTRALIDGKFIALFSLLFGFGFALQRQRAHAAGRPFAAVFLRRAAVLLLFGVLHGTLIWAGDVLTTYALLGLLLFAFARRQPRTLVKWGVGLIGVPLLLFVVGFGGVLVFLGGPPEEALVAQQQAIAERTQQLEASYTLYGEGDYPAITADRVGDFLRTFGAGLLVSPILLAMFLFGDWLARRGVLHDPAAHTALLKRLAAWGLAIGLPIAVVNGWLLFDLDPGHFDPWLSVFMTLDRLVAGPLLCLAYLSLLSLAAVKGSLTRVRTALAPVGRMALTNYLMQSVVMTLLMYGYGLGWTSMKLGWAPMWGIAALLFVAQISWSRAWLTRHAYGPAEWLWRAATYGRRPPAPATGRTLTG